MNEPIDNHLDAIESDRDVARLLRGVATADRTHPVAREWVRRWGPGAPIAFALGCTCAAGRCSICN